MRTPLRRSRRSDVVAALAGVLLSVAAFVVACAVAQVANEEQCSGEYSPFLGSGKQFFNVHGCLARDAGPLIDLKKRLHIYDPRWMPVIK